MKIRRLKGNWLPFLLGIQMIFVMWVFAPIVFDPGGTLFVDQYDGQKNYFTLLSYVQQEPGGEGFTHFRGMNYPFGESILYTDNSPVVAMVLRLLNQVLGLGPKAALVLFHYLLLSNFLWATWLFWILGKRLGMLPWVAACMAIAIPWTSPLILRLNNHPNLSLSAFFALTALVLYFWFSAWERKEVKRAWGWSAGLAGLIAIFSLIHMYYLPLLGAWVGGFGLFYGLFRLIRGRTAGPLISGGAIPLVALGLSLGIVRLLDPYLHLRPAAGGYDWEPWKAAIPDYVTAYKFLPFAPILRQDHWDYERFLYLGTGTVLCAGLALLVWIAGRMWPTWRPANEPATREPARFVRFSLLGALLCFFISLGNYSEIPIVDIRFENIFSPFAHLSKWTDATTHFRCLGRFGWALFFATNIWGFWWLHRLASRSRSHWPLMIALGIGLAGYALDTAGTMRYFSKKPFFPNLLARDFPTEIPALDFGSYAALLPLPYFHVGNETKGYVIDDDPLVSTTAFQLSLRTGLPILACKMSRTPVEFARLHFDMILQDQMPARIGDALGRKPILVFRLKDYPEVETEEEPKRSLLVSGQSFPEQRHMTLLAESEHFQWYRWDWTNEGGGSSRN